jgi:5-methylcytosine-specific restriction enzyme A
MSHHERIPSHVLTAGQVARMLAIAPRTARMLMDSGEVNSYRLPMGHNARRTSKAFVIEFAQKHSIPIDELLVDRAAHLDSLGLPKPAGKRSGHWPVVAHAHLVAHPLCEACGCGVKALLNVHHIHPFHEFPQLELEETNLITLCESPSHNCHLIFGHLLKWSSWNLDVVHDAKWYRVKLANRPGGPPPAATTAAVVAAHAALDEAETRRAA